MSITNIDFITSGYRVLTIIDEEGIPTAAQATVGLTVLNEFMASYQKNGYYFGWYPQTLLPAIAPLQDDDIRNAKLMFIGELARHYGIDLKKEREDLMGDIDDAYQEQAKRSVKTFDSDLTGLPFAQGGLFGPGRV